MSAIAPQQIIRGFNLKSEGPQDNGARTWLTIGGNIASSAQNVLIPPTAFLVAPGATFTTDSISMSGANLLRAAKVQVSLGFATANSPVPTIPQFDCAVSFDGGLPVSTTTSVSANAGWDRLKFVFDVPAGARAATITLTYVPANNAPSCFVDNITFNVLADGDVAGFLARKYDEVCWLCAHNAFANYLDGWAWAQQAFNVTEQLNQGARALMLDIDDERGDIYLLHGGWTQSTYLRPGISDFRKLVDTLTEVNAFLDQNPNEVVTIFFESDVKDSAHYAQTVQAFQNAGTAASNLSQKLFAYDKPTSGSNGQSWNVASQGAPTLQWMVDNNKRCVVFTSLRGPDTNSTQATAPDGWAKMWHFIRENVYGNDSVTPPQWTTQRAESAAADVNPNRTLMLLNHFPDWAAGTLFPALIGFGFNSINDADLIEQHVDQWLETYPRLPNFLAVDFIAAGYHGGPLQAVASLNARWADNDLHPDPPSSGILLPKGRTHDPVKFDLEASPGTSSRVVIVWQNYSDGDFTLLRSYARHGKIVDDIPQVLPGRNNDQVREINGMGGSVCAGVSSAMAGLIGPQCFWLFSTPGTAQVLFVAVSSPYSLLFYNNYANARWIARASEVDAFIAGGDGGDALFDSLFAESNGDTSTNPDVRVKARPWICNTWAMSGGKTGNMTVTLWNY